MHSVISLYFQQKRCTHFIQVFFLFDLFKLILVLWNISPANVIIWMWIALRWHFWLDWIWNVTIILSFAIFWVLTVAPSFFSLLLLMNVEVVLSLMNSDMVWNDSSLIAEIFRFCFSNCVYIGPFFLDVHFRIDL